MPQLFVSVYSSQTFPTSLRVTKLRKTGFRTRGVATGWTTPLLPEVVPEIDGGEAFPLETIAE